MEKKRRNILSVAVGILLVVVILSTAKVRVLSPSTVTVTWAEAIPLSLFRLGSRFMEKENELVVTTSDRLMLPR